MNSRPGSRRSADGRHRHCDPLTFQPSSSGHAVEMNYEQISPMLPDNQQMVYDSFASHSLDSTAFHSTFSISHSSVSPISGSSSVMAADVPFRRFQARLNSNIQRGEVPLDDSLLSARGSCSSALVSPIDCDEPHPGLRSIIQPTMHNTDQDQDRFVSPITMSFPRSPTHPPLTDRRISTAASRDETFSDDEDYQLFAEATTGLGPELTFRNINTMTMGPSPDLQSNNAIIRATRSHDELGTRPSSNAASTALSVLREVAHTAHTQSEDLQYQLAHLDLGNLVTDDPESWINPPDAIEYDEEHSTASFDDELPDYATSQAQAQAAQRAEATRRARELRNRWERLNL